MKRSGLAFIFLLLGCVITIERFELRSGDGRWRTILEPDHRVDLAAGEAALSFFNNNGRVPEGPYTNFRIVLSEVHKVRGKTQISGKKDLDPPLNVRKGSFVNVVLSAECLPFKSTDTLEVTVDGSSRVLSGDDTITTWH